MVYLLALILAIIGASLNNKMNNTLQKSFYVIICIYMILLMGFRYKVGIDTLSYMRVYRIYPSLLEVISGTGPHIPTTRFEPGFMLVYLISKSISTEFWVVQMIMSIITTGSIFIFLNRYCKNIFLGVVFYIILQWLYFSTEIMRESAAVGIFLLNFKNFQEGKWFKYYFFSIFSILFHYSAIIIWFFPFVKLLRSNWLFICLCCGIIVITPLVERLNELLNIAAVSGRISSYVEGAKELTINWRLAELMRSAFPVIITLLGYRWIKLEPKFNDMLRLRLLFCMGTFAIPIIFSRFANYTAMFVVVGAANLLTYSQLKQWLKIVFVSMMVMSQAYYLNSMKSAWLPYSSIFYPENYPPRNTFYRHIFMPWLKNPDLR